MEGESTSGGSTSGSCTEQLHRFVSRFVRGAGENGKPWLSHRWLPQCPSHKSRLLALVYLYSEVYYSILQTDHLIWLLKLRLAWSATESGPLSDSGQSARALASD